MTRAARLFDDFLTKFRKAHSSSIYANLWDIHAKPVYGGDVTLPTKPDGWEWKELCCPQMMPLLDPQRMVSSVFLERPQLIPEEELRGNWAEKLLEYPRLSVMFFARCDGACAEPFELFRELADAAGQELPLVVRDALPLHFEPSDFVERWLTFLWWINPPAAEELAGLARYCHWTAFSRPFLESADAIERCELHTENPVFNPKEWPVWAGRGQHCRTALVEQHHTNTPQESPMPKRPTAPIVQQEAAAAAPVEELTLAGLLDQCRSLLDRIEQHEPVTWDEIRELYAAMLALPGDGYRPVFPAQPPSPFHGGTFFAPPGEAGIGVNVGEMRDAVMAVYRWCEQQDEVARETADDVLKRKLAEVQAENPRVLIEAEAIGILAIHPDWTNKKIAETIGCNTKSLSKSRAPLLNAARAAYRSRELLAGDKSADGGMEAWEDK